jgi:hypothetical protein
MIFPWEHHSSPEIRAENRHRLEDFGRISEQLDAILIDDIWTEPAHLRRKQMAERETPHSVTKNYWDDAYIDCHLNRLEDLKLRLTEIWALARYGE